MKKPFLEALSEGGLVGDGAMGSLLYERGVYINRSFDQVNLLQPELVYGIHRDYLQAGAHLLESNTYGANRIRLEQHGLAEKTEEINVAAMDILRRAAERAAYLGGSLGPTGLGPGEVRRRERQVRNAYAEQARLLVENGADIILVESFREATELRLAVESARSEVEVPIVAQFGVEDDAKLRDGTEPGTLAGEMALWGADVVGANCNGPDVIFDAVSQMVSADILVCAFPNAGHPHTVEDRLFYLATPENFGVFARRMYKVGVHLVGGMLRHRSPPHYSGWSGRQDGLTPLHNPDRRSAGAVCSSSTDSYPRALALRIQSGKALSHKCGGQSRSGTFHQTPGRRGPKSHLGWRRHYQHL